MTHSWIAEHDEEVPAALQRFEPNLYPSASRARKALRKGEILVNRRVARCGERVELADLVERQQRFQQGYVPRDGAPFSVPVVYEDDYFAVVVKPSGVTTYSHGGRLNMRSAVPFFLKPPNMTESCLRRPQPVHRLDKATSGLLLVAKTKLALSGLAEAFERRRIRKTYEAVVVGEVRGPGVIDAPVVMEGVLRDACTDYSVRAVSPSLKAGTLSHLVLRPRTGRTHQLRRHCAHELKCPIVGDTRYDGGGEAALQMRGRGLFLCATALSFDHPISGDSLNFEIPSPPKFASLLDHEAQRALKFT